MSALRWWIALLGLVSFTAGLAGGMMLAVRKGGSGAQGQLAEYEALFVERFDLSPERTRCLHVLLASYERDVEHLLSQSLVEPSRDPRSEIAMKTREYDRLIREKVLPPGQRKTFDELSTPLPIPER